MEREGGGEGVVGGRGQGGKGGKRGKEERGDKKWGFQVFDT